MPRYRGIGLRSGERRLEGIGWPLLLTGLALTLAGAGGLALSLAPGRRPVAPWSGLLGLGCAIILLVGVGMGLYGLDFSGNLGR